MAAGEKAFQTVETASLKAFRLSAAEGVWRSGEQRDFQRPQRK